jgi:hypothetical protein
MAKLISAFRGYAFAAEKVRLYERVVLPMSVRTRMSVLWPVGVQRSSTIRERQGESGILTLLSVAEILWRRLLKHSAGGIILTGAMPRFRSLDAGISPGRPGFNPRPLHVEFVVDKVALGPDFLRVCRFSPASRILPVLSTHSFSDYRRYIIAAIESVVK